jgi:hypothetical protein
MGFEKMQGGKWVILYEKLEFASGFCYCMAKEDFWRSGSN